MTKEFLEQIRQIANKKIIYTQHALDEMNAEEEIITPEEVRKVVLEGEIIEDYPEDKRGHSCLILGYSESGRPIHVVCATKADYLGIITAYVPALNKWTADFKVRKEIKK